MPIVYKITNTENGKVYIGWSSKTLAKRWARHVKDALSDRDNRKFYNAIKKYGTKVWQTEVLCEAGSNQDAKNKEIYYISFFDSYNNGYNATKGGDGNNGIIMSEESNIARSKALKGKAKSPETVEKFRKRRLTEETKRAISESHKGMKKPWVKWTSEQITKRALSRRSLSLEQYKTIHDLRAKDMTIKEISQTTGISTDLVKKWLKLTWEL